MEFYRYLSIHLFLCLYLCMSVCRRYVIFPTIIFHTNHLSFTSFVLQCEENFIYPTSCVLHLICPTRHLSYRKEITSFVLQRRDNINLSYTSIVLYTSIILQREREPSFVLQFNCTLHYLFYRERG